MCKSFSTTLWTTERTINRTHISLALETVKGRHGRQLTPFRAWKAPSRINEWPSAYASLSDLLLLIIVVIKLLRRGLARETVATRSADRHYRTDG